MHDEFAGTDGELEGEHDQNGRGVGRDEMNLAEFPFALLSRQQGDKDSFTYEGWITDKDGSRHRQRWTVRGAGGLGLPTEYDERVIVALMAVSARQSFANRKVPFSIYQLLQLMGLSRSQKAYESVERSLERLVGVTIYAEGAFWDNGDKTWVRMKSGFHLVDKYWLAYREPDAAVREAEGVLGYFVWSEDIWKSIQTGYIKSLDLGIYFGLRSPLARRLYRFLDKRMAYQDRYQIDVFDLSGRLGMANYRYPSKVVDKLQPAIQELIAQGFLLRSEVIKVKQYTRVAFWKRPTLRSLAPPPEAAATAAPPAQQPAPVEEGRELNATLVTLGVSERVAAQLVERYDRQRILQKVDYLLWSQEAHPNAIRNPHGWLRRAIEADWGAPEGYRSAEEQLGVDARHAALLGEGSAAAPPARDLLAERYGTTAHERQLWRATLEVLEQQMAMTTFRAILMRTQLLSLDTATGAALIGVPDELAAQWLTVRLRRVVEGELGRQHGAGVTISCTLLQPDELG